MGGNSTIGLLWRLARLYGWIVAVCVVMTTVAGIGYVLVNDSKFQAVQQLVVRSELAGSEHRGGRFRSVEEMKSVEETIRTVARDRTVVREALATLTPPTGFSGPAWPDETAIEDYAEQISIGAPNGAEFGHTEVLQVIVTEKSRERAARLSRSLTDVLTRRLGELRDDRLANIETELIQADATARQALRESSLELQELEGRVGADLTELRSMTDPSGSEGPVRKELVQTRQEITQAKQRRIELMAQRDYLDGLVDEPHRLVSTPESILQLHPELRRLKESMVDTGVAASQLRAPYAADHPKVLTASATQEAFREQLLRQLEAAAFGTEMELGFVEARLSELKDIEAELEDRTRWLTEMRVPYAEVAQRVDEQKSSVNEIQRRLTDVRAARESAHESAVVVPLGPTHVDPRPIGPSRKTVVAGAGLGGLALGLAIVALLIDPIQLTREDEKQGRLAPDPEPRPSDVLGDPHSQETTSSGEPPRDAEAPDRSYPTDTDSPFEVADDSLADSPDSDDGDSDVGRRQAATADREAAPQPRSLDQHRRLQHHRRQSAEQLAQELTELREAIDRQRREVLNEELDRYRPRQDRPEEFVESGSDPGGV